MTIQFAHPQMGTINEVANIVGLTAYRIRQMVKQNKVIYIKAGNKYLINIDSLIKYLETGDNESIESNPQDSKMRKIEE